MFRKKLSLIILPLVSTFSLQANDPFENNIFKEMMQMQKEMDQVFNRMQQHSSKLLIPLSGSKINQTQEFVDKGKYYEFITNIPENKENKININAKNSMMSITAKIIEKHENKTANSFSSSSSMQMYQKSIPLPKDADEGSLKAEYKNKKLVIYLNKKINIQKTVQNIDSNTSESNRTKENNNSKNKIMINSDFPSVS
ncbi:MAG: hypothetical protein COA92_05995 [Sulfurovum sp.]|nr:MAG: hypothetical protein COA92_05995 [Sulfurovum sp.]